MQQFPLSWFPWDWKCPFSFPSPNPHGNFLSAIPGLDLIFGLSNSYSPKWNWDFLSPTPPTPALLFPSNSTFWKEDMVLKESLIGEICRKMRRGSPSILVYLEATISPSPQSLPFKRTISWPSPSTICVAEEGSQVWSWVWNESLPSFEKLPRFKACRPNFKMAFLSIVRGCYTGQVETQRCNSGVPSGIKWVDF